jgi:HD-GYP domain-containing protein (c-di-GMP phosphodiesterase class II)
MQKLIFISKQAKPYLPKNESIEIRTIITKDITIEIEKTLSAAGNGNFHFLLFVSYEEYIKISPVLDNYSKHEIFYQFTIFGNNEILINNDFNSLKNISEFRMEKLSIPEYKFIIEKSFSILKKYSDDYIEKNTYHAKLIDTRLDQEDLIDIGKSLSIEKDSNKLLTLILFLSKKITGSDAGSIYLVEEDEEENKRLRFKYSDTFSRDIPLVEFIIDINKKSIAGYVASTGEVLNIPNVYELKGDESYSFDSSFDKKYNYICKSMLVVPMRNHLDEIIGVIQLINSKEDFANPDNSNEAFTVELNTEEDFDKYVVEFDPKYNNLLEAIAGQAAISIENSRLIKQIKNQFEEFVKSSVTAIESRDPATSGHSFRVAELCKEMAYAVNKVDTGYLKDYNFNKDAIQELVFAGLLHDFGKVYIDNSIFQKAKKLYPKEMETLITRMNYLYKYIELNYLNEKFNLLEKSENTDAENNKLSIKRENALEEITSIKKQIIELNEPAVTREKPGVILDKILEEINNFCCADIDDKKMEILTPENIKNLSIERGSLNPDERKIIESHVEHTYAFVSKIPWPPEYKNIPEITLRHHESISGSGYPGKLKGRESTMLQSRMMVIADIYDALSASDRPYKKAIPLERVLAILNDEKDRGKLDPDLLDLFINEKIYEKIES